jgi:hypothetical protein
MVPGRGVELRGVAVEGLVCHRGACSLDDAEDASPVLGPVNGA